MKVKREKHRAAIALPGAFFDVGGEEPPHVWAGAAGVNVKILLPETEVQGLAGSGEQREETGGRA